MPDFAFSEFKEMVARFHDAGLEVILDVVYNHTAEGNELGPTLSFKGIDNATYYRLLPDNPRYYINDTGTGNTVNLSHPRVLQMVTDSACATGRRRCTSTASASTSPPSWRASRTASTRTAASSTPAGRIPCSVAVKLIAEPWDCGPGGYQVGGFPPGWAEWNDRFRDTVARLLEGRRGQARRSSRRASPARPTCSTSAAASPGPRSTSSPRMTASRCNDLVSYNDKHNEANGEDNRDGHSNNHSWNHGVEGPTDDPEINALRDRQMRNMLATLLLSQGTPMLLAGDEFGRTQQGNNNAYCQDNEISWVDWEAIDDDARDLPRSRGG